MLGKHKFVYSLHRNSWNLVKNNGIVIKRGALNQNRKSDIHTHTYNPPIINKISDESYIEL